MKIIHAIFSFNVGGSETMLVDILNQQCKEASVSLIIVNEKLNIDLLNTIDKRVNIHLLRRKEGNKIQLLSAFFKINQILKRINPDVIHCHDNKLFPFFVNFGKKSCLTVHNVQLSALFLKSYKKIFAISTAVQDDVKKRTGILASVVYNGIEIEQYKRRTVYEFDRENETFTIALLSRLFPEQKGQHIAMQSIRILKEQDINVKLYLIGAGDTDKKIRLKELAVRYDIERQVEFLGLVDRQWIKNNLKNYHLLIQPSLYEGFGITIIEGFACGLPVVASDLDGPEEIFRLLNAGLLVQANDPVDLAEKIFTVYQSYVSNTLKCHNYILKDKNHLRIFDIRNTSREYFNNYSLAILNQNVRKDMYNQTTKFRNENTDCQ